MSPSHAVLVLRPPELEAELDAIRTNYNTVRLHAGIGYVTPTTKTTAAATRSAPNAEPA